MQQTSGRRAQMDNRSVVRLFFAWLWDNFVAFEKQYIALMYKNFMLFVRSHLEILFILIIWLFAC